LSAQLRKSVAGFRLPDYGGGTTTLGATSSTRLPALKEPVNAVPVGTGGSGAVVPAASGATNNTNAGSSGKMRKASGFGA
jgi:hypothetical protein